MTSPTGDARSRTRLDVRFSTALALVAAVGAALLLAGLASAASRPLGWAVACATVAALIRPVIDWLDRRLPHALAVVLTLVGVGLVLGIAYAGTVNTVADNLETLKEAAPRAAAEVEADNEIARDFRLSERTEAFVADIDERFGAQALVGRSTSTVSTYLVTGILVLFLIGYGPRFIRGGLAQIDDEERRHQIERVGATAVHNWRVYIWAGLTTAAVLTLVAWTLFWAIDLPAPFVLGLILGGLSLIPLSGIVLGGVPALLFAAATLEPGKVLVVLAFIVGAQLVEAVVLRPRVDQRSVDVGPALPLIGGLIGWEIYGLGGAVYTVILLVLALAIFDALDPEGSQAEPTPANS